jgi:hypothetical protein
MQMEQLDHSLIESLSRLCSFVVCWLPSHAFKHMRFLMLLIFTLTPSVTMMTMNTYPMDSTAAQSQSSKLSSLQKERQHLQNDVTDFTRRQDRLNRWYMRLAILAVILGAGLGLLSWYLQNLSIKDGVKIREKEDSISSIDGHISDIEKLQSETEIAAAH